MMNVNTPYPAPPRAEATFSRRMWPIAAIAALGILSLLLHPLPTGVFDQVPAIAALPPPAQRMVLLANPTILVLATAIVGAVLAHRVGLVSILAGTAAPNDLLRTLGQAAALGFALGLVLATADAAIAPLLGDPWQRLATTAPTGPAALALGLLYGGVTEEVMLRWGVMSLVGWAMVSILGKRRHTSAMVAAIAVAACIFGAAHLPAVAAHIELTPLLIVRTLLINGVAGLLYGWLFWRRHLEAAIAAHAATHLGLAAWRAVLA